MARWICKHETHCKYCGAKLRRDIVGHYCPSKNCQWHQGVKGCELYLGKLKGGE